MKQGEGLVQVDWFAAIQQMLDLQWQSHQNR